MDRGCGMGTWRDGRTYDAAASAVAGTLADAVEVVIPQPCAVCASGRGPVCRVCRALVHRWSAYPVNVAPVLPHWPSDRVCIASGPYRHEFAQLILAFKNGGRLDTTPVLGRALGRGLAALLREVEGQEMQPSRSRGGHAPVIIPVPSSARAFRRRGFVPSEVLARRATAPRSGLGAVPRNARLQVAPVLMARRRPMRSVLDSRVRRAVGQKGLNARQRSARAASSMTIGMPGLAGVMGLRPDLDNRPCILVDDVATTGSTLRESVRAVEDAGGRVVGAVVLASVRLPGKNCSMFSESHPTDG